MEWLFAAIVAALLYPLVKGKEPEPTPPPVNGTNVRGAGLAAPPPLPSAGAMLAARRPGSHAMDVEAGMLRFQAEAAEYANNLNAGMHAPDESHPVTVGVTGHPDW